MVHTRETRATASEVKFLIAPALAPRIAEWARTHLEPDPHGQGVHGDEYETTSLYFDTRRFDVFHRRGSYGRAKYRIRRYGDAPVVFLERKLRKPGILVKRRTVEAADALERLELRDPVPGWAGEWFHRRLLIRRLGPVCQVSYHRMARNLPTAAGTVRLTLDTNLHAAAADQAQFTAGAGVPFLSHALVLELKYPGRLPAVFRRLVEEFALEARTASKYRLGMAALGHVPVKGEPIVAVDPDASYA
jgi:hypothetical protein